VGTLAAQNQLIFRPGQMYDGIADLQRLTIVGSPVNPNASVFDSSRAGNAQFWGTSVVVEIAAANIFVIVPL
jgi:hypothetical protein